MLWPRPRRSPMIAGREDCHMRDDFWVVRLRQGSGCGGIEFMGRRYTAGAAWRQSRAQANAQRRQLPRASLMNEFSHGQDEYWDAHWGLPFGPRGL